MPKIVCSRLEKIQRDFLWGGGNLERKAHLVNWKTVCLEKSRGGLGVKGLPLMNQALLCKWCWRFANERDFLWRMVISTKFREEAGVGTLETSGAVMVLVYGKTSEKNGSPSLKILFPP